MFPTLLSMPALMGVRTRFLFDLHWGFTVLDLTSLTGREWALDAALTTKVVALAHGFQLHVCSIILFDGASQNSTLRRPL